MSFGWALIALMSGGVLLPFVLAGHYRHRHKYGQWSRPYQVKYLLGDDIEPSTGERTPRGERIALVQERSCTTCSHWEQKEVG